MCDGLKNEDEAELAADYGYHCQSCRLKTGKAGPCKFVATQRHSLCFVSVKVLLFFKCVCVCVCVCVIK